MAGRQERDDPAAAADQACQRTGRTPSRRDWVVFALLVVPLQASCVATPLLLAGLVVDGYPGAGVGAAVGPVLVSAWLARPTRQDDALRTSPAWALVLVAAAFVAADAVAAVVGSTTGRLSPWAVRTAVVLVVLHTALLVAVVLRRGREREVVRTAADRRAAETSARSRWRDTSEPLRSLSGLVAVCTAAALAAFAVSEVRGASTESAWVLWPGAVWGLSVAALGVCVLSDLRASADLLARRSQAQRHHRGLWAAPSQLPALRRWFRGAGFLTAAAGLTIAVVFWPSR